MFFSPLRYPGGKTKLAKSIESIFLANNLLGGTYVEPYAGGAGVALYLLLTGKAEDIVINDADPVIYAFWQTLLDDYQSFIARIEDCDVSIENWYIQKNILNNHLQHRISDVGFATFFLNRTNVSGVLKGGCIGGLRQHGNYKIDARFNKSDLIKRIKSIGYHRDRIHLYNTDAMVLLNQIQPELTDRSLIYLDPPYYMKGASLYRNFYEHNDHVEIANKIRDINTPWIVTYDNVEPIRLLYQDQNIINFYLRYSANRERLKGSEVMIYGNLQLPNFDNLYLQTTV